MVQIQLSGPGGNAKTLSFDIPRVRIGRNPDNDLVIDTKSCSRYHAELVCDRGAYRLVDLGSANGIRVGSQRVTELPIRHGISAVLGDHTLTFLLPGDVGDKTMVVGEQTSVLPVAAAPSASPAAPASTPAPASAAREIYLHYESGRQQRHLKVVSGTEYVIGRAPDADLVLVDKDASLRHARVFSRGDRFYVQDLRSTNGTRVNGNRAEEAPIDDGDRIEIGVSLISVRVARADSDDAAIMSKTRVVRGPDLDRARASAGVATAPDTGGVWASLPPRVRSLAPVVAAVALVGLVGAYFALSGPSSSDEPASAQVTMRVQVASVARKDLLLGVSATGSIKPRQSVTISSEVAARVLEVPIREGERVTEGSLVARLNDRDIKLQIEEAQSAVSRDQVNLAKEQYDRNQRLFRQGAVTRVQLDQTKNAYLNLDASYRTAQARIDQLREQITKTQIQTPITGIVVRKFVNEGELLAPGAPVAAIENMEEVLVDVEVSDRDIVKVRQGQEVEVTTDAFAGRSFRGVVDKVASAANPVSRTFNVQARIANSDLALKSGMIASLRIILERKEALVAPSEALIRDQGSEAKVFSVREGTARLVDVKVGSRLDRDVEIVGGLVEGDEVVVLGKDKLRDGQKVEPYRQP